MSETDGMNASDGAFDLSMDDDPWFNERVIEWARIDAENRARERLQGQAEHKDPSNNSSKGDLGGAKRVEYFNEFLKQGYNTDESERMAMEKWQSEQTKNPKDDRETGNS